jgi:hypothetical protein
LLAYIQGSLGTTPLACVAPQVAAISSPVVLNKNAAVSFGWGSTTDRPGHPPSFRNSVNMLPKLQLKMAHGPADSIVAQSWSCIHKKINASHQWLVLAWLPHRIKHAVFI